MYYRLSANISKQKFQEQDFLSYKLRTMNFQNILNAIHAEDPEVYEKLSPRRHVLKSFTSKVAVAALPFAVGSLFKKAYGRTTSVLVDSLSFALQLEYLEEAFYKKALQNTSVFPLPIHIDAFKKIGGHESAHVGLLKGVIAGLGEPVPAMPNIDMTAGGGSNNGPFAGYFTNYQNLLAMAQAFEDMGVRAYNDQTPNFVGYPDIIKAALGIHSVEARHAAHIRMMRLSNSVTEVKPWITGNRSEIIDVFFRDIYGGEENVTQAGVNIININGYDISEDFATQAFDEPLKKSTIDKLTSFFIYV
jgi:hypothetical protein